MFKFILEVLKFRLATYLVFLIIASIQLAVIFSCCETLKVVKKVEHYKLVGYCHSTVMYPDKINIVERIDELHFCCEYLCMSQDFKFIPKYSATYIKDIKGVHLNQVSCECKCKITTGAF